MFKHRNQRNIYQVFNVLLALGALFREISCCSWIQQECLKLVSNSVWLVPQLANSVRPYLRLEIARMILFLRTVWQARNQLGTPEGAKSFLRGAQNFWTMSNSCKRCPTHFSRGGANFSREGFALPLVTGLLCGVHSFEVRRFLSDSRVALQKIFMPTPFKFFFNCLFVKHVFSAKFSEIDKIFPNWVVKLQL